MKNSEIRSKNIEEIITIIDETRKEYMLLRFQSVSGQLTDTSKLQKIKKDIARLETMLREKQRSKQTEGEA